MLFEPFDSGLGITTYHNSIESRPGGLQSVVLTVRIQPHRQAGVLVSDPRSDDRHRHTGQVHRRGRGVPGGVQLDRPNPAAFTASRQYRDRTCG